MNASDILPFVEIPTEQGQPQKLTYTPLAPLLKQGQFSKAMELAIAESPRENDNDLFQLALKLLNLGNIAAKSKDVVAALQGYRSGIEVLTQKRPVYAKWLMLHFKLEVASVKLCRLNNIDFTVFENELKQLSQKWTNLAKAFAQKSGLQNFNLDSLLLAFRDRDHHPTFFISEPTLSFYFLNMLGLNLPQKVKNYYLMGAVTFSRYHSQRAKDTFCATFEYTVTDPHQNVEMIESYLRALTKSQRELTKRATKKLFTISQKLATQGKISATQRIVQHLLKFKSQHLALTDVADIKTMLEFCEWNAIGALPKNSPLLPVNRKLLEQYNAILAESFFAKTAIPSQAIPYLSPAELIFSDREHLDAFDDDLVLSPHSNIHLRSGNGGFLTYKPLEDLRVCPTRLRPYDGSQPSEDLHNVLVNYLHSKIILSHIVISLLNIHIGNGTTQLYGIILKKLFDDRRQAVLKNVILFPTPTYGLFLPQVYEAGGEAVCFPLLAENRYKVTSAQLETVIESTNKKLWLAAAPLLRKAHAQFMNDAKAWGIDVSKLTAFTGTEDNLNKMYAEVVEQISENPVLTYKMRANPHLVPLPPAIPRVIAFYFGNIHNPTGMGYTQAEVDALDTVRRRFAVTVIEDLCHHDINFTQIPLGYFGATRSPNQQVTLLSISKQFCAAGFRAGFAYISDDLISTPLIFDVLSKSQHGLAKEHLDRKAIHSRLFDAHVFLTPFQSDALSMAFYSLTPSSVTWEDTQAFLKETAKQYSFRRYLFQALVMGLQQIALEMRYAVFSFIVAYNNPLLEKILREGIPGIKIATDPDGSFFLLLDFSYYKNYYVGNHKIASSRDFCLALEIIENISMLSAGGMLSTDMIARVGVNFSSPVIIDAILRLARFVTLLTEKPVNTLAPRFFKAARLPDYAMPYPAMTTKGSPLFFKHAGLSNKTLANLSVTSKRSLALTESELANRKIDYQYRQHGYVRPRF